MLSLKSNDAWKSSCFEEKMSRDYCLCGRNHNTFRASKLCDCYEGGDTSNVHPKQKKYVNLFCEYTLS